uniref:RRM domain-containing protein n=1 Tax=Globisporangium ultimum (strain ATCC 200006 / CBS 805.95 / DAOM BR144) TaxID=431595 RepID=K3X837_GLOUD
MADANVAVHAPPSLYPPPEDDAAPPHAHTQDRSVDDTLPQTSAPPATAEASAGTSSSRSQSPSPSAADRTRLFIVCGRGRKAEDLRLLFSSCGAIKHLYFALDRSNKSRGFAFLEYEDPSCAISAIDKFHQLRLDDGHVLKVTIAREKPVIATGKLKRNQQSSHEPRSDSESNSEESHFPGKRQRSSPPTVSSSTMPAFSRRRTRTKDDEEGNDYKKMHKDETPMQKEAHRGPKITTAQVPDIASSAADADVKNLLDDMISAIELGAQCTSIAKQRDLASAAAHRFRKQQHRVEREKRPSATEESSTDQLTSSISSFTLDATTCSELAKASQFASAASVMSFPQRTERATLLRRRRQSTDDSDSSLEDVSDTSMSRRKRSNTSHRDSPKWPTTPSPQLPIQRDELELSPSPSLFSPSSSTKKQCKRQSSDQSADVSARSSKQRVTNSRQARMTTDLSATLVERKKTDSPLQIPRSKLFFVSTHKELKAMFAVYGDFEYVEIVKSFGRIKTMAYIKYSDPKTASSVLESFQEDVGRDEEQGHGGFMKLSLADENLSVTPHLPSRLLHPHGSAFPPAMQPSAASLLEDQTAQEKLWLLILHDRSLPSQIISSRVSSCPGMEFVDIKVFRSTGESQGVAFVKFEKETQATEAAAELHQLELPAGSGKFLQAIVILDPSLFSTIHGGPQGQHLGARSMEQGDLRGNEPRVSGGEDVDVSVVEARFAHLMRSNDHYNAYPPTARAPMLTEEAAAYQYPMGAPFPAMVPPMHGSQYPGVHMQQLQPAYGLYPPQQFVQYPSQQLSQFAYVPEASWSSTPSPPPYYHPAHAVNVAHAPAYPGPEYYQPSAFPAQLVCPVTSTPDNGTSAQSVVPEATPMSTVASTSEGADGMQSIIISSCRPLELMAVVKALDECSGVVAITKDGDGSEAAFVVEFSDAAQAMEAVTKLDGKMCNGKKLRVGPMHSSGKTTRAASSRRKRQRVDQRNRK